MKFLKYTYLLLACFAGAFLITCNNVDSTKFTSDGVTVEFEVITNELEIPWQIGFISEDRILITERQASVRVVKEGVLAEKPWIDMLAFMESQGEELPDYYGNVVAGVQGLAVDPDFEENGYVYITYAYDAPDLPYSLNKLVRFVDDPVANQGVFDVVLVDSVPGLQLHNSGPIKFGPDGKLYWAVPDRFSPDVAQDLSVVEGSILRLNPDGSIPGDNPFPGSYIYSYGHRNAQGFDWHPDTEIMMSTEHGPSSDQGCCYDEVNIIEAGNNYGWPVIRGDETHAGMKSPLIQSGEGSPAHDFTWAPSGATFVEGGPWHGTFLFAGLRSQSLWQLTLTDDYRVDQLKKVFGGKYGRLRSVEQGPDGDIYLVTSNKDYSNHPIGKDFLVKMKVYYK